MAQIIPPIEPQKPDDLHPLTKVLVLVLSWLILVGLIIAVIMGIKWLLGL